MNFYDGFASLRGLPACEQHEQIHSFEKSIRIRIWTKTIKF